MIDWLNEVVNGLLELAISLLPLSPFEKYINSLSNIPYIQYINWFIPVGIFVDIGLAWLGAIGTFYLLMVVLRWIKAIE